MEEVFPRLRLLYRHNKLLLLLLLFLLMESPFNSLLCETTATGEAHRVENVFEGGGGERQSTAIGFDETPRNRDERGGGRGGRRGVEAGLIATESLLRELVKEEEQTIKAKREPNSINIKKQLRERKRSRRGREPADGHEDHDHNEHHDKTDEHEDDHHDKDTSHEEHHDDHAHSWKYYGAYGPSNWSLVAPACHSDRPRQTPIDIQTTLTELDETLTDIGLTVSDPQPDQKVNMVNNGHTVNVVFDNSIRVSGGKLGNVFRVAGAHFHWGASDYTGSEHTINGERFPLEMHIVSYDEERYADLAETLSGDNSLAVLGVLFTISEDDNPVIEPIVSNLMAVQMPATSTSIPYFDLRTLLPPKHETHFYRYLGSLTTPPCSEVVIWTVFKHPLNISHAQVARFRELYEAKTDNDTTYLRHNWRPLQPIHGRTVARSFLNLPRRIPRPLAPLPTQKTPADHDADAAVVAGGEPSDTGCKCQRMSSSSDGLHSRRSTITMLHSSFALLTLFILSTP